MQPGPAHMVLTTTAIGREGLGLTRSYSLTAHQVRDHQGSTDGPTQASHRARTWCHGRTGHGGRTGGRSGGSGFGTKIAIKGQGQPIDRRIGTCIINSTLVYKGLFLSVFHQYITFLSLLHQITILLLSH